MVRDYAPAIVDMRGLERRACDLVGFTVDEVVNCPARELLAEDIKADTVANLSGLVVLRHRDGSPVPLPLTASARAVLGPGNVSPC